MAHWVTPPVIMDNGKQTSLGEINYGTESRMFLFAFRDTNNERIITDTSVPAYNNIVELTSEERGLFSGSQYIIINPSSVPFNGTTEVPLKYTKDGVELDTGLRLASNGQIVGQLAVTTPLSELVFKVRYVDPPIYEQDTKYRAYSHVQSNGQTYRLKPDATTPYYATSGTPSLEDWIPVATQLQQYTTPPTYSVGLAYQVNNRVIHNKKLYQLMPTIATQYRAVSAKPDLRYWTNLGTIPGTYAEYKVGTVYAMSAKVKVGTTVYELATTQPYITTTATPDLTFWVDRGVYDGVTDTNIERIFKIIINTRRSALINFVTPNNLGTIKIGQQLGDSVIKDITATSDGIVSYELLPAHRTTIGDYPVESSDGKYHMLPKGLTLRSNGTIEGCPIGPIGTYQFDVIARNTFALEKQQTFEIRVTPGYLRNTRSISLRPRFDNERAWYKMITDSAMTNTKLYRPSDSNYGICDYPEIMIKRNVKCEYLNTAVSLKVAQAMLSEKLKTIDATQCRLGNMRYRTALDEQGVPLYEILYKEVVPLSTTVVYDPNAQHNTEINIQEIHAIKTKITQLLGSDDESVMNDILRSGQPAYNATTYDDLMLWETNHDVKGLPYSYSIVVPVAYVLLGESEKFIKRAIEYGSLPHMLVNYPLLFDTLTIKSVVADGTPTLVVPLPCK